MQTAMQETSLSAYRDMQDEGKVGKQAALILSFIKSGEDYSRQEICRLTGLAVNAVSGRVNDLLKAGRIEHGDKRPCKVTGRTILPVRLPAGQMSLGLH